MRRIMKEEGNHLETCDRSCDSQKNVNQERSAIENTKNRIEGNCYATKSQACASVFNESK